MGTAEQILESVIQEKPEIWDVNNKRTHRWVTAMIAVE